MQALISKKKIPYKFIRAAPLIALGCLMVLFFSVSVAQAAVLRWVGGVAAPNTNDWDTAANWFNEATGLAATATPTNADDVIIPVTINSPAIYTPGTTSTCGSLEIRLGAKLHINGHDSLTVTNSAGLSGNVNNAGIINIAATSSPGAGIDGSEFLTCHGTLLNTGVINIGPVNPALAPLGVALTAGSLNNVGPDGAPVTGTGTINITDEHTIIRVYRDWRSAGTFNITTSVSGTGPTVELLQSGILEHTSINGFYKLDIEGSIRTLASKLVVMDELEVGVDAGAGPATLDTVGFDVDVTGAVTIGDADVQGDLKATASGGTHSFGSTLLINGQGNYNLGAYDVTVNITDVVTITGAATLGSGTVTALAAITNTGKLTSTSGNLSVAGDLDFTAGATGHGEFYHNAGTVIFPDNGAITPDYDITPGNVFNNIIKRGVGTTTTLQDSSDTPPDQLIVLGDLTVEAGTLADHTDGSTVIVEGNVLVSDNGAINLGNSSASDLILDPPVTTIQRFNPGITSTYTDIIKQGLGKTQLEAHPLATATNLTVQAGTFHADDLDVTVGGILDIDPGAEMIVVNGDLKVTGATTIGGTLKTDAKADPRHTFAALTIEPGGVYDNDEVEVIVNVSGAVLNDGAIIIGTGPVSFAGGFENHNVFTSTPGILYVSGADFDNLGQYNANEGTLKLGSGVTDFAHGGSVYHNIVKSGAGTTTTTSSQPANTSRTLTLDGVLTVESGIFATDGSDVINLIPLVNGKNKVEEGGVVINNGATLNLSAGSTLNVEGDFTNEGAFVGDPTATTGSTLHLIGSTFSPGDSDYATLLKTSEKVVQVKDSTFKFEGATWTNYGQYQAQSGSTVELNGVDQEIISIGSDKAYIAFENIKTNNTGVKIFSTDVRISGTFTIAGGATVTDTVAAAIPCNIYTFTNEDAEVVVSGTWTLTGSASLGRISLFGTDEMNKKGERWTLILNSSGAVNIDEVNLRDSELITHGGSLNGKNVGYNVVSYGNLSPSWGPFDPIPVVPDPTSTKTSGAVLSVVTTNPGASSATAAVGNTVKLQLTLASEDAVNGISAYLRYNPAVLSVVDASDEPGIQPFTKGGFIGGLPFENSVADGILRYTEGNIAGSATGAGVVASVSFVVNAVPAGEATTINFLSDAQNGLVTNISYTSGGTGQATLNGFTLTVEGAPALLGDANQDGMVNLIDFSLLAAAFGTTDANTDFNSDGYVNLADFSILAANFGMSAAAAPAKTEFSHSGGHLSLRMPAKVHRGDVVEVAVVAEDASLKAYSFVLSYDASLLRPVAESVVEGDFLKDTLFVSKDGRIFSATRSGRSEGTGVLAKLRFQVVADGVSEDAIALRDVQIVDGAERFSRLPELHSALTTVPHKTKLLANYPNPFNPETWIPFELADEANVKVQIYDVSGRLIRMLDLGRRSAGHYVERATAAYWDGRNRAGESVASGVYLYRLTAGDFSAMRRMVILK